ncbi:MAG TPA: type I-U CRISPR-associated protein Csx17 [Acidiferrobacter sp.]|nr:type I-U CRISPR-associated protein Csx17 [Acidiferrobacter sp.]
MTIHDLNGCAPTPLAHYLKALGILRLVSEQADPQARGWWEGEQFRLMTKLNEGELIGFFLDRYEPTPLVSPWNKGSGFFNNDPGLTPVEDSAAPRFERLRAGIRAGRQLLLDKLASADRDVRSIKNEPKDKKLSKIQKEALRKSPEYKKRLAEAEGTFKTLKADLVPQIRLHWRGPHREWMDAAMVLGDEGTPHFPALLGTGGNDGRLDFTNNYFQRLNEVFDLSDPKGLARALALDWFESALTGAAVQGLKSGSAVGQYFPGLAGGANNSNGPDAGSLLNPVDFLLMMEGAVLFTAHATRRLGVVEQSRAVAPFVVGAQGAGYASAADSDESARGEQWMPLWAQPMTLSELRYLLGEGRAQIGTHSAREPLDLGRAIARLGTARGIVAFQRYGYIERNGQSNLAIPLGRFRVPDRASPRLACLGDLETWLPRLRREARRNNAPNRLKLTERQLAETLFAVTQRPDESSRWQAVLLALAAVEALQVTGSGFQCGPIPKLRPEWAEAANDDTAALRLALSFALQARTFSRDTGMPLDSIRRHWLPLDRDKPWKFTTTGTGSQTRLQIGSDVVIQGRRGVDDAIAMVERRLIEAAQRGERRLPLQAATRTAAHPTDLAALVAGTVDMDRTLALSRALMALDRMLWPQQDISLSWPQHNEWPDDAWLAIRLAMLPWPLPDGRSVSVDPAVLRRLESGDAATAVELALRRLRAAGIYPSVRVATVTSQGARLWAAALCFPISRRTAMDFVRRLDPHSFQETA